MPRTHLLLCLLLTPLSATAWNAESHRLTGLVAAHLLREDQPLAASIDLLLDRLSAEPRHRDLVGATVWMDDTVRRGVDAHWHYINLAFDGSAPAFDATWAAQQGQEHAPWALDQARATLIGNAATDDKVKALGRLLHLVGDLHQPLHCAERGGDSGGNGVRVANYLVERGSQVVSENLHTFWDWAAGLAWRDGRIVHDRALVPRDDGPALRHLIDSHAPTGDTGNQLEVRVWARESYLAACTAAYGRAPVNQGSATVTLPSDYVDRARDLAQARLVLAGWRLAAQLRALRPALMALR